MKKILKVFALVLSIILFIETVPVYAIESIVEEMEESIEETTGETEDVFTGESAEESFEEETDQSEPRDATEEEDVLTEPEETSEEVGSESEETEEIESEVQTGSLEKETEVEEQKKEHDRGELNDDALDISDRPQEPEAEVIAELIDERDADIKKFKMSDGTVSVVSYPVPVHFKDDEGNYVQINNSPTDSTDEGDEVIDATKDNVFDVHLLKEVKEDKLYTLTYDDDKITVSIEGAEKSEIKTVEAKGEPDQFDVADIAGTYIYEDILEKTDIRYSVISTDLKENVILKDHVDFNTVEYVFNTTSNICLVRTDEGTIEVKRASSGEVVAVLSAPIMWDSAGEINHELNLSLEQENDATYRVSLCWDDEWANDEERVYPITVDPVIQTQIDYTGASTDIDDAFAQENIPAEERNVEFLRTGRTDLTGRVRSVIKVHLENYVPKNANIVY
ncbi:MAG: hypothetical protein IJT70_03590, partial [Clostridia bacterium]|nr:hypothetical protein [Clostridia bacterium]